MKNYVNEKVLITTSSWFLAPDGKEYRAVWGTLKGVHEAGKTLGFIPNRSHANWFIEIGDMCIMGCQVMYLIKSPNVPELGAIKDYQVSAADGKREYERPTKIYITQ